MIFAAYGAMAFVATPFSGPLSDRYGRRPVLLVAVALLLAALAGLRLRHEPRVPRRGTDAQRAQHRRDRRRGHPAGRGPGTRGAQRHPPRHRLQRRHRRRRPRHHAPRPDRLPLCSASPTRSPPSSCSSRSR
ncbi:hypothetical protein [Streptomyces sp. NPDC045369]|uniref:hypothetical protein n=1 Tax=Streptomyces sp. NPDC045369 TaxID=3155732 RepID=UPI0033E4DD18